ncbi:MULTISPECIES: SAM-dependent methyltransferase [Mycolicibacterium]|uniref:S-adenosyl-L-methionine-dependent methyltransferase n=1 Tax=Mycolicibacterium neoaurum TaxID=1795 RepID=A0AAV2WIU1_MYCNE|nr:SAM-dependent methyltransferase [Mycolicibacterium neoaurum]TLH63451.1 SAM-dependent methyltransferase [Mycolicibacterium neoaurum]CDQ43861.1 putative methyltransferase [Mycolicibacterium neoaurum]
MRSNPAARTAIGPMLLSAIEALEPPQRRLIDDDLAASFLPRGYRALARMARAGWLRRALIAASDRSGPGLWAGIACRKRYIDDKVSDPASETDAVVILGSGLDTRPYRIARYSDLPVFEVDQQASIDRKRTTVERALGAVPASVQLIGLDLERERLMNALHSNNFRDTGRTLYIAEGLTQYLSPAAVHDLFAQLRQATAGSRLVFTYVRADFVDGIERYESDAVYRRFVPRLWKSGFAPEQLEEMLRGYGWRLIEQAGPSYYRDIYIRPTGRPLSASPIEWTALAVRSD